MALLLNIDQYLATFKASAGHSCPQPFLSPLALPHLHVQHACRREQLSQPLHDGGLGLVVISPRQLQSYVDVVCATNAQVIGCRTKQVNPDDPGQGDAEAGSVLLKAEASNKRAALGAAPQSYTEQASSPAVRPNDALKPSLPCAVPHPRHGLRSSPGFRPLCRQRSTHPVKRVLMALPLLGAGCQARRQTHQHLIQCCQRGAAGRRT